MTASHKTAIANSQNNMNDTIEKTDLQLKDDVLAELKYEPVETSGSNVELSGNVRNLAEREEAERAAWAAPGVFSVDNQLTVKWFELSQ